MSSYLPHVQKAEQSEWKLHPRNHAHIIWCVTQVCGKNQDGHLEFSDWGRGIPMKRWHYGPRHYIPTRCYRFHAHRKSCSAPRPLHQLSQLMLLSSVSCRPASLSLPEESQEPAEGQLQTTTLQTITRLHHPSIASGMVLRAQRTESHASRH